MLLAVVCLCASSLWAAEGLVGGPYVVNVSSKSATVMWVVRSNEVKLGTSAGELNNIAPALRCEKVTYSGLKPGTLYYYEVPGVEGGKGAFKTAPEGPASFKFVVYGDTRSRHDLHQKVVDAIAKSAPDFVAHTGDLVADGSDTGQWPRFFGIEKELLKQTAFFPVLGNHERNNPQYYEFFDVKTGYYSFDWGGAHFTMLNTDFVGEAAEKDEFWTRQLAWLTADLKKAQGADFRFLVFHNPPFTAVKKRQQEGGLSRSLVPLFEQYRVTAVFNGHDHNYQRHVKNGVQYIVTGGGGAPLYPVDGPIPGLTEKVESTEHFVQVKVEGKAATLEAVALDGRVIEKVEMRAAAGKK